MSSSVQQSAALVFRGPVPGGAVGGRRGLRGDVNAGKGETRTSGGFRRLPVGRGIHTGEQRSSHQGIHTVEQGRVPLLPELVLGSRRCQLPLGIGLQFFGSPEEVRQGRLGPRTRAGRDRPRAGLGPVAAAERSLPLAQLRLHLDPRCLQPFTFAPGREMPHQAKREQGDRGDGEQPGQGRPAWIPFTRRSRVDTGRAWMGRPSRKRSRSSARAAALA